MSISPRRTYPDVTPSDVLTFSKPTREPSPAAAGNAAGNANCNVDFLCPLSANIHQIEFLEFTISDYASKNILFMVGRDYPLPVDVDLDLGSLDENAYRLIKYEFSEDVLRLPSIQTSLVFSVGEREVTNFRMVERHYFRDQLVKSFDFTFGFCIPSSTNTWDAVYQVPPLEDDLIEEMIANPHETKSDSFYFVEDKLVMHNKASYKYLPEDKAQAKRSYEGRYAGAKGAKKEVSKYDSGGHLNTVQRNAHNSVGAWLNDVVVVGDSGVDIHVLPDDDQLDEEGGRIDRGSLDDGDHKAGGRYDDDDDDDDDDGPEGRSGRGVEDQPWSKEVDYY